jgi:DNA-binding response OmpR family regulator
VHTKTIQNVSEQPKFRIMIVDDEPDITTIVKKGLERSGFAVDAFNDPMKALESFKTGTYDLVILDIRMVPITGFELFRRLLLIDSKVRVCFMTSFEIYQDEFQRLFPFMSIDCFVRKPVTIDRLAQIIKTQLA